MLKWFSGLTALGKAIAGVLLVVAAFVLFLTVKGLLTGKERTEARLGTEQAESAIESGQDAVETVGKAQRRENDTDDKVEGIERDVEDADDARSADAAGRDGLCQHFGLCDED